MAAVALAAAQVLTSVDAADEKAAGKDAKDEKKEDVPTLKKSKAKGQPVVTGYLGQKEIQEKLKITPEERAKISEAQKAHNEAEAKLYADYEESLHKIIGDERWKELAHIIEEKRKEAAAKKKKGEAKTEEKKPSEEKKPDADK